MHLLNEAYITKFEKAGKPGLALLSEGTVKTLLQEVALSSKILTV